MYLTQHVHKDMNESHKNNSRGIKSSNVQNQTFSKIHIISFDIEPFTEVPSIGRGSSVILKFYKNAYMINTTRIRNHIISFHIFRQNYINEFACLTKQAKSYLSSHSSSKRE